MNTLQQIIMVLAILLIPMVPAIIIYKRLPSSIVASGPFKGLEWRLTGGFAGYFLLVLVAMLIAETKAIEMAKSTCARPFTGWMVSGEIESPPENLAIDKSAVLTISPTLQHIDPDGHFWTVIPVQNGTPGREMSLTISLPDYENYAPAVVHLSRDPLFHQLYVIHPIPDSQQIAIIGKIHFSKLPPYNH
jgi:hypothetical protein